MSTTTATPKPVDLTSNSAHNSPGPFRIVVHGFPRYQKAIASLDVLEYIKLRIVVDFIAESYKPGSLPITRVRLIGHADKDFQRGQKFEQEISEDRAKQVELMLRNEVGRQTFVFTILTTAPNPGIPSPDHIDWVPAGVGSSDPDSENVKRNKTPQNMSEADRKLNRRVEVILEPGSTPVPDKDVAAIVREELDKLFKRQLPVVPPIPPIPSNPPLPPWFWKQNFPPPKPDEWKGLKKQIKEALHLKNIDLDTIIGSLKDAIQKDPSSTGGWTDSLRQMVDELEKARREGNKEWWKDDDDD